MANIITIDLDALDWPEWGKELCVQIHGHGKIKNVEKVRRPVPAWKPKDGEAVWVTEPSIICHESVDMTGVYSHGWVYVGSMKYPFDKLKCRPWDEI